MKKQSVLPGLVVAVLLAVGAPVMAGSHSWDIVEIFSNSDGTVQYIVLEECCGNPSEIAMNNKTVTSNTATFTFPANLPVGTSTANKSILLATAAYAVLPGAVAPDHMIVDNFIDLNDDILQFWVYDIFNFAPGELPLNGKNALHRVGSWPTGPFASGANSPTNYAGQTGSIDTCPVDLDGDGTVGIGEFLAVLGGWGTPDGDVTVDGNTDIDDFLAVLGNWGPCS